MGTGARRSRSSASLDCREGTCSVPEQTLARTHTAPADILRCVSAGESDAALEDVSEAEAAPAAWPGLAADIEMLGAPDLDRPARVAIASYEFVGVVRNGGIGTACTELALALARDGCDVDLFFTGWGENASGEGFERWRLYYEQQGVRLERLDLNAVSNCDAVLYNAAHSLALYEQLRVRDSESPYDAIHFVESLGHGFYSLLAKRQGLAFEHATTVVCAHSPRRWLAEAHAQPFDHPIEIGDEFLERRCLELADVAVAPSAHMLDWLARRGTRLPERSYVQQYVSSFDLHGGEPLAEPSLNGDGPLDSDQLVEELVFFGRLEPRKGLVTFCDALDLLLDGACSHLRRVTFLGKESIPASYIYERAAVWPWECAVVSDLDREAALDYLRQPGRLAVMASTMDNSPNTVYEAIGLGIPFLASRGGGTAELVHPADFERATYDPGDPEQREIDPGDPGATRAVHTGRALVRRIELALASPQPPVRFAVDPSVNREQHLAWHCAVASSESSGLPETIEPPEVLVVGEFGERDGEILIVRDPKAEPEPELASRLAAAAAACPDASFLTPLGAFVAGAGDGTVTRVFLPTGGPAASGLLGNCAGAGVALARRDALERVGAFETGDGAPASVADLLARAVALGERVDVVPEVLYRLPANAVSSGSVTTSQSYLETMRPYHRALPEQTHDLVAFAAHGARLFGQAEEGFRARAENAERHANALSAELEVLRSSRSLKLTAPLRRVGSRARRLLCRGRG
jgi:O-antigen biosynthesis protein